jgi:hypothetical protein
MHWAKLIIAALLALYGGSVWDPICPATDPTKTQVPAPDRTSAGLSAVAMRTIPTMLTSKVRFQSSGESFVKGKPNLLEPIAAL